MVVVVVEVAEEEEEEEVTVWEAVAVEMGGMEEVVKVARTVVEKMEVMLVMLVGVVRMELVVESVESVESVDVDLFQWRRSWLDSLILVPILEPFESIALVLFVFDAMLLKLLPIVRH